MPPGEYDLSASAQGPLGRETANMKITVQGADLDGITLTTEAPVTVNGEIAMESGALVPDPTGGQLRVAVETIGDQPQTFIAVSDDNGLVKSDGRFTFKSASGPTIVRVTTLPRGMSIKSVEVDGREMPDGVLELKGGTHARRRPHRRHRPLPRRDRARHRRSRAPRRKARSCSSRPTSRAGSGSPTTRA